MSSPRRSYKIPVLNHHGLVSVLQNTLLLLLLLLLLLFTIIIIIIIIIIVVVIIIIIIIIILHKIRCIQSQRDRSEDTAWSTIIGRKGPLERNLGLWNKS